MDIDELSLVSHGVDHKEIPAIHQKRTLAFINHFICNTVSLMNKLARSCETKLEKFETQLQRMDACLRILESKLSSIPGLEEAVLVAPTEVVTAAPSAPITPSVSIPATQTSVVPSPAPVDAVVQPAAAAQGASQDPRYARFFRMVHVGVPPQAVKIKMQSEGLDPSVLDNPNAVPPPAVPQSDSQSDVSSSNDSE